MDLSRHITSPERVEEESEVNRTKRALAYLKTGVTLPFAQGQVRVAVARKVAETPGGQLLLTLLIQ